MHLKLWGSGVWGRSSWAPVRLRRSDLVPTYEESLLVTCCSAHTSLLPSLLVACNYVSDTVTRRQPNVCAFCCGEPGMTIILILRRSHKTPPEVASLAVELHWARWFEPLKGTSSGRSVLPTSQPMAEPLVHREDIPIAAPRGVRAQRFGRRDPVRGDTGRRWQSDPAPRRRW